MKLTKLKEEIIHWLSEDERSNPDATIALECYEQMAKAVDRYMQGETWNNIMDMLIKRKVDPQKEYLKADEDKKIQ